MFATTRDAIQRELDEISSAGTKKVERTIRSPQGSNVVLAESERTVINMCANNYLGLANHPALIQAAERALHSHGFGMSSVRFICGTTDLHKTLEETIAGFHRTDDAIVFASCFDANGGLFETLLNEEDAVISDALNHASIIDGIRLCKAERHRYPNADMNALEEILKATAGRRRRLIATDGVFSMDGTVAPLKSICDLAERYNAMVMVDDSHGTGAVGPTGRGTTELWSVQDRVDIVTSTLGKALGGASGGYVTGRREIVELLRQRARPYLFSNTLPPCLAAAGIEAFRLLESATDLIERLRDNTFYFRNRISSLGFDVLEGPTAIVPIMLYDEKLAVRFASEMQNEGVYVVGFTFPVVPKGRARIRTQISAAHTKEQLDSAVSAFKTVGGKLNVLCSFE
jgi:glycine C-acetyltransferase